MICIMCFYSLAREPVLFKLTASRDTAWWVVGRASLPLPRSHPSLHLHPSVVKEIAKERMCTLNIFSSCF